MTNHLYNAIALVIICVTASFVPMNVKKTDPTVERESRGWRSRIRTVRQDTVVGETIWDLTDTGCHSILNRQYPVFEFQPDYLLYQTDVYTADSPLLADSWGQLVMVAGQDQATCSRIDEAKSL